MDTNTELNADRATERMDAAAHNGTAAREFVLTGCTAHPRGEKTHAPLETNVHGVALVFEGGGYRASYTAGIANMLLERGIYFDEVCGISAGSSHTANYISRDQNRVRRSFIDLAGIPEGGGMRSLAAGHGYFNADYDYPGCVADGFLPFDWETFAANPARPRIQSSEADTGRTVSFARESMDTFEHMMTEVRASSTLPGMMRPVRINGHIMLDGGIGVGAGIPTHLAEMDGYDKIFFVATRPAGYRKTAPGTAARRLYAHWGQQFPELERALLTRHERYNAAIDHLLRLEREGRAFIVRPDEMPVKSTTLDVAQLYASYELGHRQALRDYPRWEEWLFG